MNTNGKQFVRLWTRYQAEVRQYVFTLVPHPADAEDVLQEAAARLWENLAKYDPQRPFIPWAIRFAYLEILKWRQRQTRDRLIFSDEMLGLPRTEAHSPMRRPHRHNGFEHLIPEAVTLLCYPKP